MKRLMQVIMVFILATTLVSCSDNKDLLKSMFDIEARAAKNAPPSTIEELKAGIARYGDDVKKTTLAMEKIALYWRLLAVRYMEKGLFGDAYDAAVVALRHDPESASLYYVAGISAAFLSKATVAEKGGGAESRMSWLRTAEGSYQRSLQLAPQYSKALYGLAVLYTFEMENHEAAIIPLEALLQMEPSNVDALFVYARALYGAGRLQDAADVYDTLIQTTTIQEKKDQAAANKKQILDELYD